MTLIIKEIVLLVLCFILTVVLNIQQLALESFWINLTQFNFFLKNYHSVGELKLSLFEYIEGFYNLKRPHYSLDLMTPNERELAFYEH